MSSKDNTKSLLKKFFMSAKSSGSTAHQEPYVLPNEMIHSLTPEQPVSYRCRTLLQFTDFLGATSNPVNLDTHTIGKLCEITKDLLLSNKQADQRQVVFNFYDKMIYTQYEGLSLILRQYFYNLIETHAIPEDLPYRLQLLGTLTQNGKVITHFEDKIGPFMIKWAPEVINAGFICDYLDLVKNLINFNSAHLDESVIIGFVQIACNRSVSDVESQIILKCLDVLDIVLCYSKIPTETLPMCIVALCRTVNVETYLDSSFKIMKHLLGTPLGYATMLQMCNLLNEWSLYSCDETLLRGAVFHIIMGLWSVNNNVIPTFRKYPTFVLRSFLNVLQCEKVIVTYEVILSVQRIINKTGRELTESSWDIICEILESIANNIKFYEENGLKKDHIVQTSFHDTITMIEQMLQSNDICINLNKFYSLIEKVSDDRPEASVRNLINYKSAKISPTRLNWLSDLQAFMERFYYSSHLAIRHEAINSLAMKINMYRYPYEDELLDKIVIPTFSKIQKEKNISIRKAVGLLLIDCLIHCDTKRCYDIIDILEALLHRVIVSKEMEYDENNKIDISDAIAVVDGLIETFKIKLYRLPSSIAIKIYTALIIHLEEYYTTKPHRFHVDGRIRTKILVWMLAARANADYHIGYPDDNGKIIYSHYLGIDVTKSLHPLPPMQNIPPNMLPQAHPAEPVQPNEQAQSGSNYYTTISIRRGCETIIRCLRDEHDWSTMQVVLQTLPLVMQNKALIQGNDIASMGKTLVSTCSAKNAVERFPGGPTALDFHIMILPVIASLIPYQQYCEQGVQKTLIDTLKSALTYSRQPKTCVQAFTVMVLEVPDILFRYLPEVLCEMSKMSNTKNVSIPVLEFLSTLSRLPNYRFTNFILTHYLYVFAIILPYTNPFKYDHYTVSLAHHVIAGWFLIIRLNLRKKIANYIISGLQTYIQMPFEEHKSKFDYQVRSSYLNEDSSNRKRSSSLTEQGSRMNRDRQVPRQPANFTYDPAIYSFHMELADTCIDFLTRHTYSPYSAVPKRMPSTEFLLAGGQSCTWLVGNNLVTITTSRCSGVTQQNILCDRCSSFCKLNLDSSNNSMTAPLSPETTSIHADSESAGSRRYTAGSLRHSNAQEIETPDLMKKPVGRVNQFNFDKSQTLTSTDGHVSSSSGSMEEIMRRGSNPEALDNSELGSSKTDLGGLMSTPGSLASVQGSSNQSSTSNKIACACACNGWAEIHIRRATGVTSWSMRIQNQIAYNSLNGDFYPSHDIINLFIPSVGGGIFGKDFLDEDYEDDLTKVKEIKLLETGELRKKQLSTDTSVSFELRSRDDDEESVSHTKSSEPMSPENSRQVRIASGSSGPIDIPKQVVTTPADSCLEIDDTTEFEENVNYDDRDGRSNRNPVRRVNSSPEMNSNWRHPYNLPKNVNVPTSNKDEAETEQQKKKSFSRVSCEAIPEEIAGSTPPSQGADGQKYMKQNVQSSLALTSKDSTESNPSTSSDGASQSALPRKQHSADEPIINSHNSSMESTTSPQLTLKLPSNKVTSKPPQSPTPLSPRMLRSIDNPLNSKYLNNMDYNQSQPRGRSQTISVIREHSSNAAWINRFPNTASSSRDRQSTAPLTYKPAISPSFVFLQIYPTIHAMSPERPLLVSDSMAISINVLDYIPPFETHSIGVLYIAPGQTHNEVEILKNRYGSDRYAEFLKNLGTLISLKDAKERNFFIPLEAGCDGQFGYVWQDEIIQVTFDVATMMPNDDRDLNCAKKKKHIGNDFVSIIYNDSGMEYNLNTLSGQFNYACVIIEPLELNSNRIYVRCKKEITHYNQFDEPKLVSDGSAPLLARQLALHANLASRVYQSLQSQKQGPYASNWLERLRQIKRIRASLVESSLKEAKNLPNQQSGSSGTVNATSNPDLNESKHVLGDFTTYTS